METTINKVEIQGFLGKDAEVKTFENGRTLVSMRLATNESYKNNKGEWVTNTTWHNVTLWKNKKDDTTDFLRKGGLIFVAGKLNTRKYTDKSGQERFITEVVANKVEPVRSE
jgi:single-strand DNA-binding protein